MCCRGLEKASWGLREVPTQPGTYQAYLPRSVAVLQVREAVIGKGTALGSPLGVWCIEPASTPLITCYVLRSVTCKKTAASRLVAVSRRRQDAVCQDFPNALAGCCDVAATKKKTGFKKGDARRPKEFPHVRLVKNLVARSQPETSLLRNIGSDVDGLGEQR